MTTRYIMLGIGTLILAIASFVFTGPRDHSKPKLDSPAPPAAAPADDSQRSEGQDAASSPESVHQALNLPLKDDGTTKAFLAGNVLENIAGIFREAPRASELLGERLPQIFGVYEGEVFPQDGSAACPFRLEMADETQSAEEVSAPKTRGRVVLFIACGAAPAQEAVPGDLNKDVALTVKEPRALLVRAGPYFIQAYFGEEYRALFGNVYRETSPGSFLPFGQFRAQSQNAGK